MHDSFEVKESGLVIDAGIPCLGATPDRIALCNCHGKGVLEIKCPYKYKDGFESWQNDRDFPVAENLMLKRDAERLHHNISSIPIILLKILIDNMMHFC